MERRRVNFAEMLKREVRGQTESEVTMGVTWEEPRTHALFVAKLRASYETSEEVAM